MSEQDYLIPTNRERGESEAIRQRSSIEVYRELLKRRYRSLGRGSLDSIPEVVPPGPRVDARDRPKITRRSGIKFR